MSVDPGHHLHKPGILSKKYFGVPLVYYAALVVGVLVFLAWKLKSTTGGGDSAAGDTTDTSGDQALAGDAASSGDGYSGFNANPAPTYTTGGDSSLTDGGGVDPGTTVDTNDAWLRRGVEWGAVNGLGTADTVVTALQAYLNGDQLSIAQGQIRDKVIAHFGLPPELPTSGGTAAPPVTAPKPVKRQGTPPTYHTVQGTSDNNYALLAQLYYPGTEVHESIDLIQVANPKLPRSGAMAKGTRVFIPKYSKPVFAVAKVKLQTLHEFAVKAGKTQPQVQELNDGMHFPVKVGTHVRIA